MNKVQYKKYVCLWLLVVILLGCSKDEKVTPVNNPADQEPISVTFRFKLINNESSKIIEDQQYFAVSSLTDTLNNTVWNDKKIKLNLAGETFLSDTMVLNSGPYILNKMIVYNGVSDLAVYAMPLKNSDEGNTADFNLPKHIEIKQTSDQDIELEVRPVPEYIRPEKFGYSDPEFGEDRLISIQIKTDIQIGKFLYKSIPAHVLISGSDDQGNIWKQDFALEQGINLLDLPQYYSNYMFNWSKWDLSGQLNFSRDDLHENKLITLNGSKPAKLISSEENYIEIENVYTLQSRTEYIYNSEEQLIRRDFYSKLPQYEDLRLETTTEYFYNTEGQLEKTESVLDNYLNENLYTWMDGKINSINAVTSGYQAEFIYYSQKEDLIGINYNFTNGQHFQYAFHFEYGNKIEEIPLGGTNNNSSYGIYEYDDYINPYYLWGITDEYLRYASRNNETKVQYTFNGGFPVYIPDTYSYLYDGEGYPVQLIKTWKVYQTQQFGYREKIIYHY